MKTIEVKKKKITIEQNVAKIYPKLENLTITPSREQQIFNHPNSYGYDEVVVEATRINLQDKFVTPSGKIQEVVADENYDGLNKVTVDKVNSEVLSVTPTSESQSFSGLYSEVNVAGDSDLLPENIKKGVNIFGVDGEASVADFEINDCSYLFYYGARVELIDSLLPLCKNVTNTRYMFNECRNLTELDLSNFDTSNVTNFTNMFQSCSKLASLDLSNFDTSQVTDMSSMFKNCSGLTSLDISNFNTSNVTNMYEMFSSGYKLTTLDLSNFVTSNVTNMSKTFNSCSVLTSLNLSNFDTSKVTNMSSMFNSCNALTSLDLSVFDTSKATNMSSMFSWCSALKNLDIRNFTFDKVTSYSSMFNNVPTDCLIIVKGDTEKEWITSKFTTLTNVKTVAEL